MLKKINAVFLMVIILGMLMACGEKNTTENNTTENNTIEHNESEGIETTSGSISIETVAEIKTVNFDDSNKNDVLDENETGSAGNYSMSYLNGVEIKGDEDRVYDVGGYKYIYGTMNLEEIKAKLN